MNKRNILLTRNVLFAINMIVILFMSTIIYKTTEMICSNDKARDFLEKIRYVPTTPWKVPVFSVSLLLLLILSVIIRERFFKGKSLLLFVFCLLDIVICVYIAFYLNLSYKGIMFIAVTNIIIYSEGWKRKIWFLTASVVVYMLVDYDIFSIKVNMFSINDYIQYYTSTQRLYIYSLRNVLTSLNEIAFIFFMIFVIQSQVDETSKIKELYARLYQTAEELKIANIQLEDYAKKSEEMAKTRERNRLAREIHDTIGHALTGIATGLEACTEIIEYDVKKTKAQLIKITDLARKGLLDVRRSVRQLRPDALERFSLVPALQKLTEDINACTQTRVMLTIDENVPEMNPDEEETIYRIVQESITNSVRHGNAKEIKILFVFEDFNMRLTITDDGNGCDSIHEGFGLKHIRERVEMLNGRVEFKGENGKGFTTIVEMPIRWG